jgi:hypothetical protein
MLYFLYLILLTGSTHHIPYFVSHKTGPCFPLVSFISMVRSWWFNRWVFLLWLTSLSTIIVSLLIFNLFIFWNTVLSVVCILNYKKVLSKKYATYARILYLLLCYGNVCTKAIKRKFEHWWSTIPSISTKRTITSHLRPKLLSPVCIYSLFSLFGRLFYFFRFYCVLFFSILLCATVKYKKIK